MGSTASRWKVQWTDKWEVQMRESEKPVVEWKGQCTVCVNAAKDPSLEMVLCFSNNDHGVAARCQRSTWRRASE
jgi:hypothetical protein